MFLTIKPKLQLIKNVLEYSNSNLHFLQLQPKTF